MMHTINMAQDPKFIPVDEAITMVENNGWRVRSFNVRELSVAKGNGQLILSVSKDGLVDSTPLVKR